VGTPPDEDEAPLLPDTTPEDPPDEDPPKDEDEPWLDDPWPLDGPDPLSPLEDTTNPLLEPVSGSRVHTFCAQRWPNAQSSGASHGWRQKCSWV